MDFSTQAIPRIDPRRPWVLGPSGLKRRRAGAEAQTSPVRCCLQGEVMDFSTQAIPRIDPRRPWVLGPSGLKR
ncbi:hypothetical protein, partial [Aquitalea pelogenes]|uniref:hypothetical protein n=1 Tax=Aquitalea pelogenes TaxID=1293573 RepID=UPI00128FBEC5